MPDLAYCNGEFVPIDEAKISINDRGFVFGDSVYEVVAVYDGRPFMIDEHLARLGRSLAGIHLEFDPDAYRLKAIVADGIRRCGYENVIVYIQVTRGVAPRAHRPPPGLKPNVIMTFRPLPELPQKYRENGVAVMTTPETRWAKCFVKATTLLPNVLANMQARQEGFFDAIFVTETGEVRESTHSNVVAVSDGRLHFPARDESILHGITLQCLETCAVELGIEIIEAPLVIDDLLAADEAFLSNTVFELLPVVRVDDRIIGNGLVGPLVPELLEVLRNQRRASVSGTDFPVGQTTDSCRRATCRRPSACR